MTRSNVRKTIEAAERFIKVAEEAIKADKDAVSGHGYSIFYGSKESGALRRSSMDLTRQLAVMRKS